eukprot:4157807-Pyramimonas_sp.AAC.1
MVIADPPTPATNVLFELKCFPETVMTAPCLQQQRLPPDTSSQCFPKSRPRTGPPHNSYKNRVRIVLTRGTSSHLFKRRALGAQESRSRFGCSHDVLGNRAVA